VFSKLRPCSQVSSPVNGATISTFTDIIGTVDDTNLLSYSLEVAPASGGAFTEIANGTSIVIDGRGRNCDFELKNGSGFGLQGFIAGARFEPTTLLLPTEKDSEILREANVFQFIKS